MPKKKTGEMRNCAICGTEMYVQKWQIAQGVGLYCSGKCRTEGSKGIRRPIGRVYKTHGGYTAVYRPDHPDAAKNGLILEHRLVAEAKYGRRLLRSEDVHHINGIKDDNRPENLEILTAGDHAKVTGQTAVQKRKALRDEFNAMKIELNRYRQMYGTLPDTHNRKGMLSSPCLKAGVSE